MADDLATLDAIAQAELVRRGDLSPRELVEAAIARIERVNPELNAVTLPALDEARALAASPELPDGPFRGVPFLMKDLGGTEAGRRYTGGVRCLKESGFTETVDAYIVEKLKRAGLVILGRTNTPELGLLPTTEPDAFGPTHNPWDPTRSPGGSSGGSAAAVAAGIVPAAHASDGGGSIRIPASSCGLVGLKTSRGRNSFGPAASERWSGFSVEFAVTRSVRDAAALLDVTNGPMPGDAYFAPPPSVSYSTAIASPPPRLRVGVMLDVPRERDLELHPECRASAECATALLAELGHVVEESHPDALDDPAAVGHWVAVVAANTARALETVAESLGRPLVPGDVEPLTWGLAERGRETTATRLLASIEFIHTYGRRLAAWWESGFDLLLTPTTAQPPPPLGFLTSTPEEPFRALFRSAPFGAFTLPFNLAGQPAISLPLYWTADGVPVGAQLVAAYGREDLLLQVAAQLEQAAPWWGRRPGIRA